MANRAPTLDPLVHSISDLEKYGSSSLPPAYRGKPESLVISVVLWTESPDYYNEGAMDLVT
jgi:hypothetical protein